MHTLMKSRSSSPNQRSHTTVSCTDSYNLSPVRLLSQPWRFPRGRSIWEQHSNTCRRIRGQKLLPLDRQPKNSNSISIGHWISPWMVVRPPSTRPTALVKFPSCLRMPLRVDLLVDWTRLDMEATTVRLSGTSLILTGQIGSKWCTKYWEMEDHHTHPHLSTPKMCPHMLHLLKS